MNKSTGSLKTYDELLVEAKREAGNGGSWEKFLREKLIPYERWMDGNDDFDEKVEGSSHFHTSEQAKEQVRFWG